MLKKIMLFMGVYSALMQAVPSQASPEIEVTNNTFYNAWVGIPQNIHHAVRLVPLKVGRSKVFRLGRQAPDNVIMLSARLDKDEESILIVQDNRNNNIIPAGITKVSIESPDKIIMS